MYKDIALYLAKTATDLLRTNAVRKENLSSLAMSAQNWNKRYVQAAREA